MNITLGQFKSSYNHLQDRVERVRIEELTILWFDDFYDGVLSGMVEYKNQKCRFERLTDYEQAIRPRVFDIIKLLEEQIADETYWHELFLQHVIADPASRSKDGLVHSPQSKLHLFYEPYQKRPDPHYDFCNFVGWFVED
jgi:hypothetical protein